MQKTFSGDKEFSYDFYSKIARVTAFEKESIFYKKLNFFP